MISLTFVRNSYCSHDTVGRTKGGSEELGMGSNPSLYLHILTSLIRQKIVMPPPLTHEKFRYQNFSETRKGSPTKVLGTVGQSF